MRFIIDLTPSGTVPVPMDQDQLAEELLTYLASKGTIAWPDWILSVDDVNPAGA